MFRKDPAGRIADIPVRGKKAPDFNTSDAAMYSAILSTSNTLDGVGFVQEFRNLVGMSLLVAADRNVRDPLQFGNSLGE